MYIFLYVVVSLRLPIGLTMSTHAECLSSVLLFATLSIQLYSIDYGEWPSCRGHSQTHYGNDQDKQVEHGVGDVIM